MPFNSYIWRDVLNNISRGDFMDKDIYILYKAYLLRFIHGDIDYAIDNTPLLFEEFCIIMNSGSKWYEI